MTAASLPPTKWRLASCASFPVCNESRLGHSQALTRALTEFLVEGVARSRSSREICEMPSINGFNNHLLQHSRVGLVIHSSFCAKSQDQPTLPCWYYLGLTPELVRR